MTQFAHLQNESNITDFIGLLRGFLKALGTQPGTRNAINISCYKVFPLKFSEMLVLPLLIILQLFSERRGTPIRPAPIIGPTQFLPGRCTALAASLSSLPDAKPEM